MIGSASVIRGPHIQVDSRIRPLISTSELRLLRRRLRRAALSMGVASDSIDELCVRICSVTKMQALNLRFRGQRGSTDVLSFPSPAADGSGDLALDWRWVMGQAHRFGRTPVDEGAFLLVHGVAHLLGHDHASRAEARRMLRWERRGLRAIGVADGWRPYGGG